MRQTVPASLKAATPHYQALVQQAATPHRATGATVLTFTGMARPQLHAAAISFASAAGRPLYRVDLTGLVSKYIGETEKNLDAAFGRAEHGNSILLFDEADALFGQRSSVKDAHDKYANLEVAFLQQKIAGYRGTVIILQSGSGMTPSHHPHVRHHTVRFPP